MKEPQGFRSEFMYRVSPEFAFHWLTDFQAGKGLCRVMSETGALRVRVHEDARLVERLDWKPISRFTIRVVGPHHWTRVIELYDTRGNMQAESRVDESLEEVNGGTLHHLETVVAPYSIPFRVVYVLGGRRSMIRSLDEQYRTVKSRIESDYRATETSG